VDLTRLSSGFRDSAQRWRAQSVVKDRLVDDRLQDECRYILRFFCQLAVSYREVTMDQLRERVGAEKLAAIEALVEAISRSPEQIDSWIDSTEKAFPVIHDRSFLRYEQGI
jgi:hypothetical protein